MILTPDNPFLVEKLISMMEKDGVFDVKEPEEAKINIKFLSKSP